MDRIVPERGPKGRSDSGRTVFFPVGTDRPARRRPAALDRPGHSRPVSKAHRIAGSESRTQICVCVSAQKQAGDHRETCCGFVFVSVFVSRKDSIWRRLRYISEGHTALASLFHRKFAGLCARISPAHAWRYTRRSTVPRVHAGYHPSPSVHLQLVPFGSALGPARCSCRGPGPGLIPKREG
jgi:hypothetical protein